MTRLGLAQRLSLVFAALLLLVAGVSIALQIRSGARHEQALAQHLSVDLAAHIAQTAQLMDKAGWRSDAVRALFDRLMMVNPAVEVYLLDNEGAIVGNAAPPGHLKRDRVALAPIRRFLDGAMLPVTGDDPRSPGGEKVFSAAPVMVEGRQEGYVYVILEGETRDALAARLSRDSVLRSTLLATLLVAAAALVMGLVAFSLIIRPLRALTETVRRFGAGPGAGEPPVSASGDEIAELAASFAQMERRIGEQWRELERRDQERRDLIANISHDLRTPLASLHGYLETLRLKEGTLSEAERQRYLGIALGQSTKLARLAGDLFDLARLESGLAQAEIEAFSLADLAQDVAQKFDLAARENGKSLAVQAREPLPLVLADLAMVERVLTNLIDNAIRHTPAGTKISLRLQGCGAGVMVEVADDGPGIPEAMRQGLFTRAVAAKGGGLGLVVVQRMLGLNGAKALLADEAGPGTTIRFTLPGAPSVTNF